MPLTLFQGNRSPSISDTIRSDGVPVDLTGANVRFRMRDEHAAVGDAFKVDALAQIVAPLQGQVRYDWGASDLDTPGDYTAWWQVVLASGKTQDTPDFDISVLAHALLSDQLTTISAVRRLPSMRNVPDVDNEGLDDLITSYSRTIRHYTGRQFLPREPGGSPEGTSSKTFSYDGEGFLSLEPFEAREITAVVFVARDGVVITPQSWEWYAGPEHLTTENTYLWLSLPRYLGSELAVAGASSPPSLQVEARRWYSVRVTGRWGAGIVPGDVDLACRIAVANAYRNPEGMAGRTVGEMAFSEIPEDSEVEGLALPRDSRKLLTPYRRKKARMRGARTTA